MSKNLNIKVWHGGRFTGGDNEQYLGGTSEVILGVDPDTLSMFDFEGLEKDFGYKNVIKKYWKFPKTHLGFRHPLETDKDILDMIDMLDDGETVDVYFEHAVESDNGGNNWQIICVVDDTTPLQVHVASVEEDGVEGESVHEKETGNCQMDEPAVEEDIDGNNRPGEEPMNRSEEEPVLVQEEPEVEAETEPEQTNAADLEDELEEAARDEPVMMTDEVLVEEEAVNVAEQEHDNNSEKNDSTRRHQRQRGRPKRPNTHVEESDDTEDLTDFSDPDIELDKDDLFCEKEAEMARMHSHVQHSINEINVGMGDTQNHSLFDEEEEDYVPSDELLTASDSSSDSEGGEVRKRWPIFNEKTGFGKNIELSIGMQFRNRDVFRRALREYAIQRGFDYDYVNNKSQRVAAQCREEDCPWKIRASLVTEKSGSTYFQIKALHPHVNCGRNFQNSRITAKFLGERYLEMLRDNPKWSVDSFCKHVKRDLEVDVSHRKCYNAKRYALQLIEGAKGEQYKLLRDYGAAIMKWNAGSTFSLKTSEGRFQRVYICLDACRKGFLAGCRPIISLDACHLKGQYPGQIHSAVGRDGNENMFPIAYAICESESKSSWVWFLQNLLNDIGNPREGNWCFISDQQKGLQEALKELAPQADHRFCVRHLYANFCKVYKGKELKDAMWACARAATEPQFVTAMDAVKALDVNAYTYLTKINPAAWSRHAFSTYVKSDALCSNISECFNAFIKDARDKPIITCLDTIRQLLMKRFYDKRTGMENLNSTICPRIRRKVEENQREAMHCTVTYSGGPAVQVMHTRNGMFRVDIHARMCSCRVWDLTGIPCTHGAAAILHARRSPSQFLHHWYKQDIFLAVYQPFVEPLSGPSEWPRVPGEEILPPLYKRQAGRPRQKRMRPVAEPIDHNRKRKVGESKSCGKCKGLGHNRRNCPNEEADPKRSAQSIKDASRAAKNRLRKKQGESAQTPGSLPDSGPTNQTGKVKKAKVRRKAVVAAQPEMNERQGSTSRAADYVIHEPQAPTGPVLIPSRSGQAMFTQGSSNVTNRGPTNA